jgi:hypothetical protein
LKLWKKLKTGTLWPELHFEFLAKVDDIVALEPGNAYMICGAYPPFKKKHILSMKKNSQQKFRAYISTFYVRITKFRDKPIFLVLCVEKTKSCHV